MKTVVLQDFDAVLVADTAMRYDLAGGGEVIFT